MAPIVIATTLQRNRDACSGGLPANFICTTAGAAAITMRASSAASTDAATVPSACPASTSRATRPAGASGRRSNAAIPRRGSRRSTRARAARGRDDRRLTVRTPLRARAGGGRVCRLRDVSDEIEELRIRNRGGLLDVRGRSEALRRGRHRVALRTCRPAKICVFATSPRSTALARIHARSTGSARVGSIRSTSRRVGSYPNVDARTARGTPRPQRSAAKVALRAP